MYKTSTLWHHVRKGRLTASNFGSVLNAGRITPSLLKRLLGEYDLSRVKAIQWGVQNEAEAINHFRKFTGLPVAETGKWCSWHFSGWPDRSKSCIGSEVPIYTKKLNNC